MNKKGQTFVIIIYILSIIIIGLAFAVLHKPAKTVYDMNHNMSQVQDDEYQTFYTRTRTVWIWLPLMLIIPVIYSILIKSQIDSYR